MPLYSPDLNLIEELFAELKAFIKRHWQAYADNPDQGFDTILEWCVDTVGRRKQSAEGSFGKSGLIIEELLCGYHSAVTVGDKRRTLHKID